MLATILTFALLTTYVIAEMPSYVHVCGRRDSNLNQCIADSVINLRNKLCQGIPEIEIPSLEPLFLSKVILSETNNVKLYTKESQVMGLCSFVIDKVNFENFESLDFNLSFGDIYFNSTYDFFIRIMVTIASKGQFSFTADKLKANFHFDIKMITKNGKKHLYASKVTTNIDIIGFKPKFSNNNSEDQLQEIITHFIGNNQKEVLTTFTPALEEAVSKVFISTLNKVLKQFTFDEIFPDRI